MAKFRTCLNTLINTGSKHNIMTWLGVRSYRLSEILDTGRSQDIMLIG